MTSYQCPRCDTPHDNPNECPECGPGPQDELCPTHVTGYNPNCHACRTLVAAAAQITL